MEQFVLDASVGIKWFFREELTEQALHFRRRLEERKIEALVPEFFFAELANICWMKVRKESFSIREVIEALDRALDLPFTLYSTKELSDVALENALRFNISAHDGLYLALSEVYVAPFVTADKQLFQRCRKRFDFIEYLGNVKVP